MDKNDPKAKAKAGDLKKPHYQGKIGGVHVYLGTDEAHRSLVGVHLDNANDNDLKDALKEAKASKKHVVVCHGAPPEQFRTRIHQELGTHKPGEMRKSEVAPIVLSARDSNLFVESLLNPPAPNEALKKAFFQPDQQTMSDLKTHVAAKDSLHPALLKWGTEKLSSLPKDAIEQIELDGKTIKVRKLDADLYNGWVEHKGNKTFAFEKVTMPDLMAQLHSKLELYGKEEQAVTENKHPVHQHREDVLAHLKAQGIEHSEEDFPKFESLAEAPKAKEKLLELKEKVQAKAEPKVNPTPDPSHDLNEIQVEIPRQELLQGMLQPEESCEACERPSQKCICFTGMPRPRLEFDGKKVTVFFKSESWDEEAQSSFIEDLKRRAGRILFKKYPGTP